MLESYHRVMKKKEEKKNQTQTVLVQFLAQLIACNSAEKTQLWEVKNLKQSEGIVWMLTHYFIGLRWHILSRGNVQCFGEQMST